MFCKSRIRDKYVKAIKCGNAKYSGWNDFLTKVGKYSDWEYIGNASNKLDGYFYYKKVVPVNAVTEPLFTNILIDYGSDSEDSNLDKIAAFDVIVYSETVQTTEIDSDGKIYQDSDWKTAWEKLLKIS